MRLDFEHSCSGARNGRDPHKSPDGALTARWWAHGAGLGPPVAPLLGAG